MIDKRVETVEQALAGIEDGASIMIHGFGGAGVPVSLMHGLEALPVRALTIILNSARFLDGYAPTIFADRRVRKAVVSAARSRGPDTSSYERQWLDGELEIEMVPQGTLAERMRAAGAGIAAFYTPTGVGTDLTEGKETREFDGKAYVLETALPADFAFIRGTRADRWGNVVYHGTQANFGPAMAMAARTTIVEVAEIIDEPIPAKDVDTPGIYVQRVIALPDGR